VSKLVKGRIAAAQLVHTA